MSGPLLAPDIVCPDWCQLSRTDHLEQLAEPISGGDVVHKSAPHAWATVSLVRRADGSATEGDQPASVLVYARDIYPATREAVEEVIRDLQATLVALET
jgi:hypothetical protein